MRVLTLILPLLFLATMLAAAEEHRSRFPDAASMDAAGGALRRSLTAWQEATREGLPSGWYPVEFAAGEKVGFGSDVQLFCIGPVLLGERADAETTPALRLLVTTPTDSHAGELALRETKGLGPIEARVERLPRRDAERALVLVRRAGQPKLASSTPGATSPAIRGDVRTLELRVSSDDADEVAFSKTFLREFQRSGGNADGAARAAFAAVPPRSPKPSGAASVAHESPEEALRRRLLESGDPYGNDLGEPYLGSAVVTLRALSGESSAVRSLESELAYRSDGRATSDPRITAQSGGEGGQVTYGSPGDRFQARVRALEREGRINVANESLTRVPIGGTANMSIQQDGRVFDVILSAERAGRDAVMLEVDLIDRTSGTGQASRQRVRVRNGGTIPLTKFESSRTSSASSGPPLVQDIPYIGGVFGNSRRTSDRITTALFATVEIGD